MDILETGQWRARKAMGLSNSNQGWVRYNCLAWRREALGELLLFYINTWGVSAKPDCFKRCTQTGWEAVGTNQNIGKSPETGIAFTVRVDRAWSAGCPEKLWSLISEITKNHGPGQLALGGPAWIEILDQMTFRSYFQSQPFHDYASSSHGVSLWLLGDAISIQFMHVEFVS